LYSSPSIIKITKSRSMRWAGNVAWMRAKRNAYGFLVGKPEWKRPLGRPRVAEMRKYNNHIHKWRYRALHF
jgi:hypothetical protein